MSLTNPYPPTLQQCLLQHFGFNCFRPFQEEAIRRVLQGDSLLVMLATGYGKSLIYQVPALLLPGLTVVVSPLIALMKDQADKMAQVMSVAIYNSSISASERRLTLQNIQLNRIKVLYTTPETLTESSDLLTAIESSPDQRPSLMVIDEAHCISSWGHSFRPSFLRLCHVIRRFNTGQRIPVLALTATAITTVRADICKALLIPSENQILGTFARDNIYFDVRYCGDSHDAIITDLLLFLNKFNKQQCSGIIYCHKRETCHIVYQSLQLQSSFKCGVYHGDCGDDERKTIQQQWMNDDIQIVVATLAFGMGIDKSNVRFVVHYDLPNSMERFYQEAGRCGRDGLPATSRVYYHTTMKSFLLFLLNKEQEKDKLIKKPFVKERSAAALASLQSFLRYCESYACRRLAILSYFEMQGTTSGGRCCDVCEATQTGEVSLRLTILTQTSSESRHHTTFDKNIEQYLNKSKYPNDNNTSDNEDIHNKKLKSCLNDNMVPVRASSNLTARQLSDVLTSAGLSYGEKDESKLYSRLLQAERAETKLENEQKQGSKLAMFRVKSNLPSTQSLQKSQISISSLASKPASKTTTTTTATSAATTTIAKKVVISPPSTPLCVKEWNASARVIGLTVQLRQQALRLLIESMTKAGVGDSDYHLALQQEYDCFNKCGVKSVYVSMMGNLRISYKKQSSFVVDGASTTNAIAPTTSRPSHFKKACDLEQVTMSPSSVMDGDLTKRITGLSLDVRLQNWTFIHRCLLQNIISKHQDPSKVVYIHSLKFKKMVSEIEYEIFESCDTLTLYRLFCQNILTEIKKRNEEDHVWSRVNASAIVNLRTATPCFKSFDT